MAEYGGVDMENVDPVLIDQSCQAANSFTDYKRNLRVVLRTTGVAMNRKYGCSDNFTMQIKVELLEK